MSSTEKEIIELRGIVKSLADELAIIKLLSRYGPAADAADHDAYVDLFTNDGVPDSRGNAVFRNNEVMTNEIHQQLVNEECAHIGSLPYVKINGDTATAYQYNCLYKRERNAEGVAVKTTGLVRLSFVRNHLERVEGNWKIKLRTSAPIDGGQGTKGDEMLREVYRHENAGR